MNSRFVDENRSMSNRVMSNLDNNEGHDGSTWTDGVILTPDGIVWCCYAEERFTRLVYVIHGREYSRRWDRRLSRRSIAIQARRFVADCVDLAECGNSL